MVYRSHNLGELRKEDIGKEVILSGWVDTKRDLGGLTFLDLRDREGKTQIVFDTDVADKEIVEIAQKLRNEAVIRVVGEVKERASKNLNIPTGEIEVFAKELLVLNQCDVLPFQITGEDTLSETVRLKYRYLDIRRPKMAHILKMRHTMIMAIRNYMDQAGFWDIDTPVLTKSTPEGARDFLVPSRMNPKTFYALPQSPQLFKQLLMIGGVEKYFQIAKCFRDEALRADRQPEFTQLDVEMSFVTKEDVMNEIEGLAKYVFKHVTGEEASYSFEKMPYAVAMGEYGSDKPDLRFEVKLKDITDIVANSSFKAFSATVENKGIVKAIVAPKAFEVFSRKVLGEYEDYAKQYFSAKGMAYIKISESGEISSSIAKFLSEEEMKAILERTEAKAGDVILIVADKAKVVHSALGALRLRVGEELGLINKDEFKFLWVVDFPMFDYDEEEGRYKAEHHPFTSIKEEDMEKFLAGETEDIRTNTYDLVLNGSEIGGGSIRISNTEIQAKVFERLSLSPEEAKEKFGFFLDAFKFGAPPHGGLAFGIDRWLMVMLKEESLRDVIPFPKTNKGQCLMTEAPGRVEEGQLEELFLKSTYEK